MSKRTLEELNLLDDFLLTSLINHPQYGESFSRLLLKIIFGKEFNKLKIITQKVYYGSDTTLHGTRLDVYLEEEITDSETLELATIYDVEADQNDDFEAIRALPKRVRFYHAKIDAASLQSGVDYGALKNVVIIMIMPYDPFGENHMIYTVSNRILELPELPYDDGAKTIFFYTKGEKGDLTESIQQLMHYMENTTIENAMNPDLQNIHKMVEAVKENKELRTNYMNIYEREQMLIRRVQREERKRVEQERQRAERERQRADALEKELAQLRAEIVNSKSM